MMQFPMELHPLDGPTTMKLAPVQPNFLPPTSIVLEEGSSVTDQLPTS